MTTPIVASDLDGTITTAEAWRGMLAWIRANHPSREADWFVRARLPLVVASKAGLLGKEQFRARWFAELAALLRGLPERRMEELGETVVAESLWPSRRPSSVALVQGALAAARAVDPSARLVIATGAFVSVAEAFARRIGAQHGLGTPLEVRDGIITGRLAAPVQTGEQKAQAVQALAAGGPIVAAFGDTAADAHLLRLAARPVAVVPDRALRAIAMHEGWEVADIA